MSFAMRAPYSFEFSYVGETSGTDPQTGRPVKQKTWRVPGPIEIYIDKPQGPFLVGTLAEDHFPADTVVRGPVITLTAFTDGKDPSMTLRLRVSSSFNHRAIGVPWWIDVLNSSGGAVGRADMGIMSQVCKGTDGPTLGVANLAAKDFAFASRCVLAIINSAQFESC